MSKALVICPCGARYHLKEQQQGTVIYCQQCHRALRIPLLLTDSDLLLRALHLESEQELRGRLIDGKYKILQRLGQGGMSVVYRGWDSILDLPVAIKILKPAYNADKSRIRTQRFLREASLAMGLVHQRIVQVRRIGTLAPGIYYLVMDFCPGRSLARILTQENSLCPHKAIEIGAQLLEALAFAHRQGVLHRDVKPANIMVDQTRPNWQVRLLDFGIARILNPADPEQTSGLTRPGTILGTLRYMAPEQARGEKVDYQADIYAAGAVLYHMLAGQPPFVGSRQQVLHDLVHQKSPLPLHQRSQIPAGLSHIIMSALHSDPSKRPTAEQLRRQLLSCGYQSESLRPGRRWYQHKTLLGGILTSVLVLALVIGYWLLPYWHAQVLWQRAHQPEYRTIAPQLLAESLSYWYQGDRQAELLRLLLRRAHQAHSQGQADDQIYSQIRSWLPQVRWRSLLERLREQERQLYQIKQAFSQGRYQQLKQCLQQRYSAVFTTTLESQRFWLQEITKVWQPTLVEENTVKVRVTDKQQSTAAERKLEGK